MMDYRLRIFSNKLLSTHRNFRSGVYDRKSEILSEHKETLFGRPPALHNGKFVPNSGSSPDMDLIDKLVNIEVV